MKNVSKTEKADDWRGYSHEKSSVSHQQQHEWLACNAMDKPALVANQFRSPPVLTANDDAMDSDDRYERECDRTMMRQQFSVRERKSRQAIP